MELAIGAAALLLGATVVTKKDEVVQPVVHVQQQQQRPQENFVPNMSDQVTPDGRVVRFNKVDYADSGNLPLEFVEHPNPREGLFHDSKASQVEAANAGAPLDYGMGMSLTGEPINPASFVHNNMTPFFGGNLKQNVDDDATHSKLDRWTGQDRNYQHKREIHPMFQPHGNITNPYGMANYQSDVQNRFIPSIKRSGEAPIQPQQVGPGLNKGYTAEPSGGFQQADTRDYVLPKTVDELRPKNDPKITYQGRVITGHKELTRGQIGVVEKQNPDTFYINTPDRYFTTTGAYSKPRHNSTIIMREQNRKETGLKRRINPAGPAAQTRESRRAKVQASTRTECMTDGPRHANAVGQWQMGGTQRQLVQESMNQNLAQQVVSRGGKSIDLSDYGRGGMRNVETVRACTGESRRVGGAGRIGHAVHNKQAPRRTRKTNVIGNPYWGGQVAAGGAGVNAGAVYDPSHQARTTIKETLVTEVRDGNITGPEQSYVYDPNDVARTTIKETTLHDTGDGNLRGPTASYVYDPNDTARTTIKETTIHNNRSGNVGPNQPSAAMIRNGQQAKKTHRQTQHTDYTGGAAPGQEGGAYTIKQIDLPNTNRQFTTTDYTGGASSVNSMQQSRKNAENMEIRSVRNSQLRSHFAGQAGPSQIVGQDSVNMQTSKYSDLNSKHIEERGLNAPVSYNSAIPVARNIGAQNYKVTVPNQNISNRLDAGMLDALRTNPYAKSLHSSILD